ncbi:hypothetical protein F1559_004667 [Cyanidiococcus yangmingshanensis]|uniref:Uncharacterized protein n=1 Tax=Cyanidiococcus yangmingshanensis TaxID=2690220 RepID=A0A7J7IIE1_9RHOD|nr:hypothetical protein F1559_004667 [Cyanidiococcus yangmingshanensis]
MSTCPHARQGRALVSQGACRCHEMASASSSPATVTALVTSMAVAGSIIDVHGRSPTSNAAVIDLAIPGAGLVQRRSMQRRFFHARHCWIQGIAGCFDTMSMSWSAITYRRVR